MASPPHKTKLCFLARGLMSLLKIIFFSFIVIANYYSSIAFAEDTSSQDDWPANYLKAVSTPTPQPKTDKKKSTISKYTNPKCSENAASCGDYISKKVEKALGDMDQFAGQTLSIQVKLDNSANIISKSILRSSSNANFDNYVLLNIEKAAPFTELLSLDNDTYQHIKTINMTLAPSKKTQQKLGVGR